MRQLIADLFVSVDGYAAEVQDEMDWVTDVSGHETTRCGHRRYVHYGHARVRPVCARELSSWGSAGTGAGRLLVPGALAEHSSMPPATAAAAAMTAPATNAAW